MDAGCDIACHHSQMDRDQTTTIETLKEAALAFAKERDWEQFHSLKNLSMALAGEAAELMEPFQWAKDGEDFKLMGDAEKRLAVEEELADVLIYAMQFANRAEIDIASAIRSKMEKNALKYPVELAKGSSKKRK